MSASASLRLLRRVAAGIAAALLLSACAGELQVRGVQGVGEGTPPPSFSRRPVGGRSTGSASKARSPSDAYPVSNPATTCNGHRELCDRRYNEVAFPMTHNSFAVVRQGFKPGVNANQSFTIQQQLRDGIRVFMLNTYRHGGQVMMCHGDCMLGRTPHLDALRIFDSFLRAHPGEVITIIYEDFITPESAEADFREAGLLDDVYTHDFSKPWPTLGEMVAADTRLVVMAENRGGRGQYPWYHDAWKLMWDTPYGSRNFSCALNRGSKDNDLFLMNHWANTRLGLPSASNAAVVNHESVLLPRANQCAWEAGRIPNFVAVDFYNRGDIFAVIEELNGFGKVPMNAGDREAERDHTTGAENFNPE